MAIFGEILCNHGGEVLFQRLMVQMMEDNGFCKQLQRSCTEGK